MVDLTDRFDRALAMAAALHRSQRRKGTEIPYVSHLLAVAAIALEMGADEDQAIAALFHDAVEDQGGPETLQSIENTFGQRVAAIVDACTDADTIPKPPWRARKEAYLDRLEEKHSDALVVSLADKLHNARTILHDLEAHGECVWERFRGGKDGSLWYYSELARKFEDLMPGPGSRQLGEIVRQLHEAAARVSAAP
jgi:(p)ppGpp synthase/HD superfamily hydrolase